MDKEIYIKRLFDIFEKHKRKSNIAQIGGFRPTGEKYRSKMGGSFLMKTDEEWPSYNGNLLHSILQINIDELPYKPVLFNEIKIITIFIDLEDFPFDKEHGNGWLIRTYKDLNDLQLRENPIEKTIKSFEINWHLNELAVPDLDYLNALNDISFLDNADIDISEIEMDYQNCIKTKIGGWPSVIQHLLGMDDDSFVIQIGSEEKVHLNWVDSGNVYIGFEENEWKLECQFF